MFIGLFNVGILSAIGYRHTIFLGQIMASTTIKIYEGPSMLDPEIQIAAFISFESSNDKTGKMAQLWIMVKEDEPHTAQKLGTDKAVCGHCPQRPEFGGECYVVTFQGPLSLYRANINKPVETLRFIGAPLRFGAYGDPLALPRELLENILGLCSEGWTGYTHQWGKKQFQWASNFLMASTETDKGKEKAEKMGWATFHVSPYGTDESDVDNLCDNSVTGSQCFDCKKCDGRHGSVGIVAHGQKSKRNAKKG